LTNISSLNSENKSALPPAARLARLLNGVGQRLHAGTDAMARQHGWEVTQRNGGLGRRYRDPRFDSLIRCPSCGGMGTSAGQAHEVPCGPCDGTGRLTSRDPALVPRGARDA
jgi:hypothetical protein